MKKRQSIDGFVSKKKAINNKSKKNVDLFHRKEDKRVEGALSRDSIVDRKEINSTIEDLDLDSENAISQEKQARKKRVKRDRKLKRLQKKLDKANDKRLEKDKRPLTLGQFKRRRAIKRVLLIFLIVVFLIGGKYGYAILDNTFKIISGSLFDIMKKDRLQEDENGRTNVIIFGTAREGWEGSELTDSIMILSVNQTDHSVYTVSLPRDLYVKHTCRNFLGTTAGRINETYICGKSDNAKDEDEGERAGSLALASTAKEVTGLDIQYYAHVNWDVLVQGVDSIGGIDLTIEAYDGSREIHDYATNVRYRNGQRVHLNGEQALALSRARGSKGGIGFSGGNFDREKNQQKIMKAALEKINASGMANPSTFFGLINALGDNLRTNFKTSEIQTIADLAKNIKMDEFKSIPLVDDKNDINLMRTSNIDGASVVVPSAGTYSYRDIQAHIKRSISSNPLSVESAKIVILNGTDISGLAAKEQDKLSGDFIIDSIGTAPDGHYDAIEIYSLSSNKPNTISALTNRYKTKVKTNLPSWIKKYNADVVIVIGKKN